MKNLLGFILVTFFSISPAAAANISQCDDRSVLSRVENYVLDEYWRIPRKLVIYRMEFLTETLSNSNIRVCQVRFRSRLSEIALREMNDYLRIWKEQTGGADPPWWLTGFGSETITSLTFSLKYDLLKKSTYVTIGDVSQSNSRVHERYKEASKAKLDRAIEVEKIDIERRRREAMEREEYRRRNRELADQERKAKEPVEVSAVFKECVDHTLNKFFKRYKQPGATVDFSIGFVNGEPRHYELLKTNHGILAGISKQFFDSLYYSNCHLIEKVNGRIDFSVSLK